MLIIILLAVTSIISKHYIIYEKELDSEEPYNRLTVNYKVENGEKNLNFFITNDQTKIYDKLENIAVYFLFSSIQRVISHENNIFFSKLNQGFKKSDLTKEENELILKFESGNLIIHLICGSDNTIKKTHKCNLSFNLLPKISIPLGETKENIYTLKEIYSIPVRYFASKDNSIKNLFSKYSNIFLPNNHLFNKTLFMNILLLPREYESELIFYDARKNFNINPSTILLDTSPIIEKYRFKSTMSEMKVGIGDLLKYQREKIPLIDISDLSSTGFEKIDERLTIDELRNFKVINGRKFGTIIGPVPFIGVYHELLEICFSNKKAEMVIFMDLKRNNIRVLSTRVALLSIKSITQKENACPSINEIKNDGEKYSYFAYNAIKRDLQDEFNEYSGGMISKRQVSYLKETEVIAKFDKSFIDIMQLSASFINFKLYDKQNFNCQHFASSILRSINPKYENANNVKVTNNILTVGSLFEFKDIQ